MNTPKSGHYGARPEPHSLLLVAVLLLSVGCAAQSGNASGPALNEPFQLRIGRSTVIAGESLEIGFEAVSADSRCGKGEVCVWEGDAVVQVWLRHTGGSSQALVLHTAARQPGAAVAGDYGVRLLALDPLRMSGHAIATADYVATLTVTRGIPEVDRAR